MSAARSETISLYKQFVRLRHQYPNKQGRSKLRRWAGLHFSLKDLQFRRIAQQKGRPAAEKEAQIWRIQARKDLDMWSRLAAGSEDHRRAFINRVLQTENK